METEITLNDIDMMLLLKFNGTYYFITEGYLFKLFNVEKNWRSDSIPYFNASGILIKSKIEVEKINLSMEAELDNINKFKPELEKFINK